MGQEPRFGSKPFARGVAWDGPGESIVGWHGDRGVGLSVYGGQVHGVSSPPAQVRCSRPSLAVSRELTACTVETCLSRSSSSNSQRSSTTSAAVRSPATFLLFPSSTSTAEPPTRSESSQSCAETRFSGSASFRTRIPNPTLPPFSAQPLLPSSTPFPSPSLPPPLRSREPHRAEPFLLETEQHAAPLTCNPLLPQPLPSRPLPATRALPPPSHHPAPPPSPSTRLHPFPPPPPPAPPPFDFPRRPRSRLNPRQPLDRSSTGTQDRRGRPISSGRRSRSREHQLRQSRRTSSLLSSLPPRRHRRRRLPLRRRRRRRRRRRIVRQRFLLLPLLQQPNLRRFPCSSDNE